MRMRPKVLVLIKGLGLGGAERLLVDAIPFLNRQQFDTRWVISCRGSASWFRSSNGPAFPFTALGAASSQAMDRTDPPMLGAR